MTDIDPEVKRESNRRRTFAIISHPDAGKTTLTEKLLLYGGQIATAGAVRGRKTDRAATSDWMELEKQRGISVTSTVLTFEYQGMQINLLDTPGHHDFSEDTYRTLVAADCAVMVIDLAKGVESQTEKLFEVCAMRKIPVLTFVNKTDRPGQDPFEILENIEKKLRIKTVPHNWPIGTGADFSGIVELGTCTAHLFGLKSGAKQTEVRSVPLDQLTEQPEINPEILTKAAEDAELLAMAGESLDRDRFLAGEQTPVFFGSALTNYGLEHFLKGFLELCPSPRPRDSNLGLIPVERSDFAGFVFKIQANLDPRHRDRVAFVRVCAGRFKREMEVNHPRSQKKLKLKRAHKVFGQDRETMDEAYPGDIIGLVNPGEFQLGDTICEGSPLIFDGLPQFSPEFFATLRPTDTSRRKQFARGVTQLLEEGAIQMFTDPKASRSDPILAAVGELQFDVVRYRLENEYSTETIISWLPYKLARWIPGIHQEAPRMRLPSNAKLVRDHLGYVAVLFRAAWDVEYCLKENPDIQFAAARVHYERQLPAEVS